MKAYSKAAIAISALLLGATGTAASAAVINFNTGSDYTSGSFGRGKIAAGDFTDTLTFTTDQHYDFSSSFTSTASKLKGIGDIDFSSITLSHAGTSYSYDITNNGGKKGVTDTAEVNDLDLYKGAWTLAISGHSYGNASYSGTTTAFASGVPEPASWAMLIFGVGAIGGTMRRAHRKSEESFTAKVRGIANS